MTWHIPAKTFLLGEYAAVAGASAIVLTTSPCFRIEPVTDCQGAEAFHPDSPAGRWLARYDGLSASDLSWHDPWAGRGGLGASSAQFLGAWLATCDVTKTRPDLDNLLAAYHQCAWQGQGLRPSGYDVMAQSQHQCVYINRQKGILSCHSWDFADIAFVLLHSGQKLATHRHLQDSTLPDNISQLSDIVDEAQLALKEKDSDRMIYAVNAWQKQMSEYQLITSRSLGQLDSLKADKSVLAAKGCGAMGSDVLLLIVPARQLEEQVTSLGTKGWTILATSNNLYCGKPLIQNNTGKGLEISS